MEMSKYSAYAREKYQIEEQHKWSGFPGLFDAAVSQETQGGYTIVLEETQVHGGESYCDTRLPFAKGITRGYPENCTAKPADTAGDIPERIRQMMELYEYGDGSLAHKAGNFYRQGKWMEDYEDDAPWQGEYRRYFTTYHDLNVRQLRGYFTWRTHVRKGDFCPIATSLAYLYLYELLSGIGTGSPEDAMNKMREFERGYLESGIGDADMEKNLHKWMFEYGILHGLPLEAVVPYMDSTVRKRDASLAILKAPGQHTEEDVFSALSTFAGKKPAQSPAVGKDESKGKHMFAQVWKYLSEHYHENGRDIFTACFGEQKSYQWYPLSNAVYYEDCVLPDTDYVLNECREYHLRDGVWRELRYESLYFDKTLFQGILRETDRVLRKYFKTGRYLRKRQEEAWLAPYLAAVMEAERLAEIEANRPVIAIDFSSLTQIRQEALVTRDSLLTKEETLENDMENDMENDVENDMKNDVEDDMKEEEPVIMVPKERQCQAFEGLDALHLKILTSLLKGQSADDLIKAEHLMPSVVTDTINGAMFDEIGDNILDCDGDRITFVDDYREEVLEALGGNTNE